MRLAVRRKVVSAEAAYYAQVGEYGGFAELEAGNYIDDRFAADNLGNGISITTAPANGGQTYTCVIAGATMQYTATEDGKIDDAPIGP